MKLVAYAVVLLLSTVLVSEVTARGRVMPWMCLERCNHTSQMILSELSQINKESALIRSVAYEEFNLGAGCKLDTNDFTAVGQILSSWGLETYSMISSFPYPPEFLDWMRSCFRNPMPFINHAVEVSVRQGFTGYNVDWEPHLPASPQDAADYANFLDLFAKEMHKAGKKLTVAVATWNPIWNLNLIGKTSVDKIMTMSTYTANQTTWVRKFNEAIDAIPVEKLGIGLQDDTAIPVSIADLKIRVQMAQAAGVKEIDIWQAPIPDSWLPVLRKFGDEA